MAFYDSLPLVRARSLAKRQSLCILLLGCRGHAQWTDRYQPRFIPVWMGHEPATNPTENPICWVPNDFIKQ
eukprot:scaffold5502_cov115-Cylindrotheca_fusiformis.AAC.7